MCSLLVKGEFKGPDPTTGRTRIELNDTNRPDLWSAAGIARQIRARRRGKTEPHAAFTATPGGKKIVADPQAQNIRPYVAGFIARGPAVTDASLADWFALLRRGKRYTATGTSDSHSISNRPVGWPRTFVCVENDSPPRLELAEFTASLKRGCATVSAGPFVTLRSGPYRMGELVPAAGGSLDVEVDVQAPTWIGTDRLILFADGEPKIEVPLSKTGVMRHHQTHRITCKSDCFVVALVDSAESLVSLLSLVDPSSASPPSAAFTSIGSLSSLPSGSITGAGTAMCAP